MGIEKTLIHLNPCLHFLLFLLIEEYRERRSKPQIIKMKNPKEPNPDYMLGVESVRFFQFPGVYSGSIQWYEVLRCSAVEELLFYWPISVYVHFCYS